MIRELIFGIIEPKATSRKHIMNHNTTAILVVEFQKTWTQASFFHKLIQKEYKGRDIYRHTKTLLDFARRNNITIIQSPFILDKSDKENYKKIPFLPKLFGQFTANTWRAEYTEGIFDPSDLEVTGRTAFDNTIDSNLEELLSNNGINTIYFAGFTTDHCVAETMDTLISKHYNCILLSNCTATRNSKLQKKMADKYDTISSQEFMKILEQ